MLALSFTSSLTIAVACLLWSSRSLDGVTAFAPQQRTTPKQSISSSSFKFMPTTSFCNTITPSSHSLLYLSSVPDDDTSDDASSIDITVDPRLYRVRVPRFTGIEWGTDLSFSFVYVRQVDPSSPVHGMVQMGDQLCELRAVVQDDSTTHNTPSSPAVNLIGATFDSAMTAFAELDKTVEEVELVFFRGTKPELQALCAGVAVDAPTQPITITVIQDKGSPQETIRVLQAPQGCNLRKVLVEEYGINVYQSITRWTNCKGKQLCGTCIVNVKDGSRNTNWKSMDEASTLRENPDSYRLSCVTFCYGDVTVETFPALLPSQWTR